MGSTHVDGIECKKSCTEKEIRLQYDLKESFNQPMRNSEARIGF